MRTFFSSTIQVVLMDQKKEEHTDEFLNHMVDVCEVKSYREMYIKLVQKHDDLVRCDKLFAQDAKYSIEKIQTDVLSIPEIVLIQLFEPPKRDLRSPKTVKFTKNPYLITEQGLLRVIQHYRSENYIGQDVNWGRLMRLWEIRKEEEDKVKKMVKHFIETKAIQAQLTNPDSPKLHFLGLLEIPGKRKKLAELIAVSSFFIITLVILLRLTKFI